MESFLVDFENFQNAYSQAIEGLEARRQPGSTRFGEPCTRFNMFGPFKLSKCVLPL